MSKVLVTGASGLLGTEFCRQLKAAGHEVWALDNHSRSTTIPDCNQFVSADLQVALVYETLPKDFDYIYHYGAINGTTNFYERPNEVLKTNFVSDLNIFEFASQCPNLKRIVYASSSEVVSDDPTSPVPENTDIMIKNIHNARWSYRLAKVTSENFLANSKLPYVMIRYFNVYGPGEGDKGGQASPFEQFRRQAEETGMIKVFEGSDKYRRDFVPVQTVVDTHIKFFDVQETGVWNIGSGKTMIASSICSSKAFRESITRARLGALLARTARAA